MEKRKAKLLGNIMRHNLLLQNIFEGKILETRPRGRLRISYLENTVNGMDCNSYISLKRIAMDKEKWLQ